MVVCPECGERATLENYEAWTPAGGWKRTERITCLNVRPKQGEPCGKKTVLSETKLDRTGSPLDGGGGGKSKPTESATPEQPTTEQPTPEPQPAEPAETAQPAQDRAEPPAPEQPTIETEEPLDDEQPCPGDGGNRRFPKYSPEQYQRLIELVEGGMTCPQASQEVGIQVNTAYGIIGKYRRSMRGPNGPRRAVLTLVPSRAGSTTAVARIDAPFKTSSLMTQLVREGISSPGRLLNSADLEAYFKLTPETQENLRIFHAMRSEIAEADKWTEEEAFS